MATFDKGFIYEMGSLDEFAKMDLCYKIFETSTNFIAIRSEKDEIAMRNSRYCQDAELVWEKGRNIPYDYENNFILSKIFEGRTKDIAFELANQYDIPKKKIKSIELVSDVKQKTDHFYDKNKEEAFIQASKRAKYMTEYGYFDIGDPVMVSEGNNGSIEVIYSSEDVLKEKWKSQYKISHDAKIEKIECLGQPQKLFGVSLKKGKYRVWWYTPYAIKIEYKQPAKVELKYCCYSK